MEGIETVSNTKKVQASTVFLTWPQSNELDKEQVLEFLKSKNAKWALIGQEVHETTMGVHIHALVELSKRLMISGNNFAKYWDINLASEGEEQVQGVNFWHGNYKAVKHTKPNMSRIIKYICVDDGCDTNPLAWNFDWSGYLDGKRDRNTMLDSIRELGLKGAVEQGIIGIDKLKAVSSGVRMLDLMDIPSYTKRTKGIWLWGAAGIGKTSFVTSMGGLYGGLYRKGVNKWWDGYNKEGVVVMDDPDLSNVRHLISRLKVWADQAPCMGEVKGDQVWLHHKHFILTTNWNPKLVCEQEVEYNEVDEKTGNKKIARRLEMDYDAWAAITRRYRIVHVDETLTDNYGMKQKGLFMQFSPSEFPDNEWCEFHDIVPKIDYAACEAALLERFPQWRDEPEIRRMRMWNSWVPIWLARQQTINNDVQQPTIDDNPTTPPPAKQQPPK
nr:MAG: rep protein [Cressdnaviricota sp.]